MALEQLRAVFGYEASAWSTAVPLYLDALGDIPADLLAEAVATSIRLAGAGDFFPKPGAIRALVAEEMQIRRRRVEAEARQERRAEGREEWPDWLRDIWGPLPQGRWKRNEAIEAHKNALAKADAWRNAEGQNARYRQGRKNAPVVPRYVTRTIAELQAQLGVSASEQPSEANGEQSGGQNAGGLR